MLRIEYVMREQGKSQTDVAKTSGINRVTINRIVRGWENPNDNYARGLANALDWPADRAAELFKPIEVV